MIELRWLEKEVYEETEIGLIGSRTIRVLQYREFPKGCIPGNVEPEWVDVPVTVVD